MRHPLKLCLLKLGASLLLLGTMATALTGQSAFAATCNPAAPFDATGSTAGAPATCTMTFNATNTGGILSLAAPAVVNATASNAGTHISTFSFNSTVVDDRSGIAGWNLQASTPGLDITGTGSGNPVFPHLNSTDTITPAPLFTGGGCATPVRTAITLTITPQEFVRAPDTATATNCTYPITTSGTIDFSGHLAGVYAGTVTLTLLNTAAGT